MTQKLSFDAVLELLVQQETLPHYDVLLKWQDRYPEYKEELMEYFATWGIQESHPVPSLIDKDRLAAAFNKRAMEMLRRQGRIAPKEKIESLSRFEQLVLTAVYLLDGEADAMRIAAKVGEMSGQEDLPIGRTAEALSHLQYKFLVDSWTPDTEIGPEALERYFTITMTGERALAHAKATSKVVADLLGDFAL